VAVELEGGTNTGGRHVRPAGYEQDVEKYNQAVVLGWRLLRFTSQQLDDDPLGCVALVVAVLAQPPASAILTIT
jgi:very-short-patch-repair endonuclease